MIKPGLGSTSEEIREYIIWLDRVGGLSSDKTLRDDFAGQANESDIMFYQNIVYKENRPTQIECTREEARYKFADAMIEARRG